MVNTFVINAWQSVQGAIRIGIARANRPNMIVFYVQTGRDRSFQYYLFQLDALTSFMLP